MKMSRLSKEIFAVSFMWSCITSAGNYTYSQLQMKTYDEMRSDVEKIVRDAKETGDEEDTTAAQEKLRDALRLIFSRPNTGNDNMVSQLIPAVRTPLRNLEAYEQQVQEVAAQAIQTAKNASAPAKDTATAIVILENIMSEMKPDIPNKPIIRDMFVKIRDAKIEISNKVKSEFRWNASKKAPPSPSITAEKVLKSAKTK